MDISSARLDTPHLEGRFAPVYWEPLPGSRERLTVIIAFEPDAQVSPGLTPAAHIIIPIRRLRAMFGATRADSASGILRQVEFFMTRRLCSGLSLEKLEAPFVGFTVGEPRAIQGFSFDQMIIAAIQMVSAMGCPDEILEDTASTERITTPTTREFVQRVQTAFVGDDRSRRARFARTIYIDNKHTEVTLDYTHHRWLVQFASLPTTPRQAGNMAREAESKLLEMISAQQCIDAETRPILIINRQSLARLDPEAKKLASQSSDRFHRLAEINHVEPVAVDDKDEAVEILESLV